MIHIKKIDFLHNFKKTFTSLNYFSKFKLDYLKYVYLSFSLLERFILKNIFERSLLGDLYMYE